VGASKINTAGSPTVADASATRRLVEASNAQRGVSASVEDDSPFGDPFESEVCRVSTPSKRPAEAATSRATRAGCLAPRNAATSARCSTGVAVSSTKASSRRHAPTPAAASAATPPVRADAAPFAKSASPAKGSIPAAHRASVSFPESREPTTHTISPGSTPNHTFAAPPARASRDDSRSSPNSESLGAETPHAANANVGASRASPTSSPTSSPNDPVDARLANRSTRSRSATTKGDVAAVAAVAASVAAASTAPADDPSRSLRRVAHSAATSATPHATAPHIAPDAPSATSTPPSPRK